MAFKSTDRNSGGIPLRDVKTPPTVRTRMELLADTLETWQPYYSLRLTVADALGILLSRSRLVDVV